MRTRRVVLGSLAALAVAAVLMIGCGGDGDGDAVPGSTILDVNVNVDAGGGGATVFFRGEAGQTIRITLTGPSNSEPYGFLEPPGGSASYIPPNNGRAGTNQADVTLTATGQFSYTVFDGSNNGGVVHVVIQALT